MAKSVYVRKKRIVVNYDGPAAGIDTTVHMNMTQRPGRIKVGSYEECMTQL